MITKVCSRCKKEKNVSEFHKNNHNKDGYKGQCKECCRLYVDEHIEKKRLYEREHRDKYRLKTNERARKRRENLAFKEARLEYEREYRKRDYVKKKTHERTNTQKFRDNANEYRRKNHVAVRERERRYEKEYNKSPEVRLMRSVRARLVTILKRSGLSKSERTIDLVGCTYGFLRKHLESLWEAGMTWENYGLYQTKWTMDHIIPLEAFDLSNPLHRKACSYWKNLQPMWWTPNVQKGAKYKQEDFDAYIQWFTENVYNK